MCHCSALMPYACAHFSKFIVLLELLFKLSKNTPKKYISHYIMCYVDKLFNVSSYLTAKRLIVANCNGCFPRCTGHVRSFTQSTLLDT